MLSPTQPPDATGVAIRLLSLMWPRGEPALKSRVVGAVALIMTGRLINIGAPILYRQIIDALSSPTVAIIPAALMLAYGVAHIGTQLAGALRQLIFISVAQRAVRLVALRAFEHLHALSLRFHLERRTGGVSRVVQRGTSAIEYLLELALFNVLPTLLELSLVCVILWHFYSVAFALAVVVTMVCYGVFTMAVTRWQVAHRRAVNECDVAASVLATDSVLNYETVKYFGAEALEAERFGEARRAYERVAIRSETIGSLFAMGQAAIIATGLVTLMVMAGRGVAADTMTVGDFVMIISYLLQLYAPLAVLATVYGNVKQSMTDIEAMDALLAEPSEVRDRSGAGALFVPRGHIAFDGVSFSYDPRRAILRDIAFEVPPGKTVALVGPSGGGKSTLARLLFRFYDVDAGTITIDGQDLRDVTQASLRRAIGVVPQDTVLFNNTILYNIAYGRPDARREEVEEAARLARMHDFILRMPDGYDSMVGERGLKLSGGEKQRVAIARVILKRPPILIFDEATSALDSHTEREIQASLRTLSRERSTLVIAHRLSTIVEADEILVLDGGRIAERGNHAALVAQGGIYAAMWTRQRRHVIADAHHVDD